MDEHSGPGVGQTLRASGGGGSLPLDVGRRGPGAAVAEPGIPPRDVAGEPRPIHRVREVGTDHLALDGETGLAAFVTATATTGVPVDLGPTGMSLGRRSAEGHGTTHESE
ncbi:MAG: hypothetical protein ACREGJ_02540 [Candidatus Saccharimonadales bacterium]